MRGDFDEFADDVFRKWQVGTLEDENGAALIIGYENFNLFLHFGNT